MSTQAEQGRATSGLRLIDELTGEDPPPFALLHRPEFGVGIDVLAGDVHVPERLADVPLSDATPVVRGGAAHEALVVVPYRQITERGFTARDDGAPLLALAVTRQERMPVQDVLTRIPDVPIRLAGGRFDVSDEEYAALVDRIVSEEIGTGSGANFVIRRTYMADVGDYSPQVALSAFRRLVEREQGAYWTFVIHTGLRTFVGATPERHVSVREGTVVMNPISGTYRYPAAGPTLEGVTDFLADRKETDELYMVLDEELKMMSRICDNGPRVTGPYLKEMARLAHTEYFIEGSTGKDPREVLRETLFAPTVTGSPLESAARVIHRHEPDGRGYYAGVAALIGRDTTGRRSLDSAILIRTADIEEGGRLSIGVGATLVRHSDPAAEVAETRAKTAGVLHALRSGSRHNFRAHPDVRAALALRNSGIADFWLRDAAGGRAASAFEALDGLDLLVVDAEDTFTAMLGRQLRSLGLSVTVRRFDEPYDFSAHDLVVMGPGPGDPRDVRDPRIAHLRSAVDTLLEERRPFVAVCLSHQVLSLRLGLELRRRPQPNQGVQRRIDLFGSTERVGFYNTYAAHSDDDKVTADGVGTVEVSGDPISGEVHGLRGPHFASMQFHPESVLTVDGPRIVADSIQGVLGR
ncbi:phenazine-specific anthranilate synthase component I [Streptomyces triticagri]|uniref:anthranilate synthase n=1 Tax=Streptomyces triticagri TaxID=2293568 RepID=A0A372M846_9ACTN|nr:anthranilate synthase family protein [Streptomyces triticagri]RFU86770.1 phenazine-specific anthranilate synthase component I [Streptomyces triticagri]